MSRNSSADPTENEDHFREEIEPQKLIRLVTPYQDNGRKFTLWKGAIPYVIFLALICGAFLYWQSLLSRTTTIGSFAFVADDALRSLLPEQETANTAQVQYTVRSGDALSDILSRYGLSTDSAQALNTAYRSIENQEFPLMRGQQLSFVFENGALKEITTNTNPSTAVVFQPTGDGAFTAAKRDLARPALDRVALGSIETSFAAAANKTGIGYDLVDDLVDLFSDRVAFHRDFRKGDRFTVIYRQRQLPDGSPAEKGNILAAELEVNNTQYVAIRYVGSDGKARYFNKDGELLGDHFLRYPLKFSRISSYFSTARFHPVLKVNKPHNGIDFAAPVGTPVRTVANGRVEQAGWNGGSGIMIKINHNDRYSTVYLHLSKLAPTIKSGVMVTRGEVIGAVGSTGLATGPHLHFGLFDRGRYVDPLKADLPTLDLLEKGQRIDKRFLQRVLFTLDHYQALELENIYAM